MRTERKVQGVFILSGDWAPMPPLQRLTEATSNFRLPCCGVASILRGDDNMTSSTAAHAACVKTACARLVGYEQFAIAPKSYHYPDCLTHAPVRRARGPADQP